MGEALRRARESLDLELEDIAQATHVRAAFIGALERGDLEALPGRPFAIGYVRAYARALGIDQDQAVARFRKETPVEDVGLRPPLGIALRRGARFGGLMAISLIVIGSLAGWNLFVRVKAEPHRAAPVSASPAGRGPSAGPTVLGAPLPAPPEATTPPPYETPGLAQATAAAGDAAAAAVTARIAAEAAAAPPLNLVAPGAQFVAHGAVYGAGRGAAGGVVLQALRPFSLVVRGAGGEVYFARELAAGEAWRAPALAGLTVDADDPAAAEIYVGGRATGPLTETQTPVESLITAKPAAA